MRSNISTALHFKKNIWQGKKMTIRKMNSIYSTHPFEVVFVLLSKKRGGRRRGVPIRVPQSQGVALWAQQDALTPRAISKGRSFQFLSSVFFVHFSLLLLFIFSSCVKYFLCAFYFFFLIYLLFSSLSFFIPVLVPALPLFLKREKKILEGKKVRRR